MTTPETIITVSPKTRTKGYESSFLGEWNPQGFITSKLMKLNLSELELKLPIEKYNTIKLIIKNIKAAISEPNHNKNSYLPQGFEDREAQDLSEAEFLEYILYRYKYNVFPKLKILDDYPPCVQIEPTSICNFRCVMCYQIDKSFSNKSGGHMGMMSFEMFQNIVDELEGNVHAVTMASRGEPMLNPHLSKMLEYAGSKFLGFKLNTNASMLTEEMCHNILSSGLNTLVFSADSADKEAYERIRVNGNFDSVYKNIARFQKIRIEQYPHSKLQTKVSGVKISDTDQDFGQMVEFWKDHVDEVAFVHYNPWQSAYENEINEIETPCSELWRRMFIWQNGDVNPCDYDYKTTIFYGMTPNIKNLSITEIWRSELYQELRNKHLNKNRKLAEPCKRCISV